MKLDPKEEKQSPTVVCHKVTTGGGGGSKYEIRSKEENQSQLWSVTRDTTGGGGGSKSEIRSKGGKAIPNQSLSQGILLGEGEDQSVK